MKTFDLKKRVYFHALDVIRLLDKLPRDYVSGTIAKQLIRSATSIGANLIEAQSSSSRKDFLNYYQYSLKSSNESRYWLALLRDSGKIGRDTAGRFIQETKKVSNILASIILKLKYKNS